MEREPELNAPSQIPGRIRHLVGDFHHPDANRVESMRELLSVSQEENDFVIRACMGALNNYAARPYAHNVIDTLLQKDPNNLKFLSQFLRNKNILGQYVAYQVKKYGARLENESGIEVRDKYIGRIAINLRHFRNRFNHGEESEGDKEVVLRDLDIIEAFGVSEFERVQRLLVGAWTINDEEIKAKSLQILLELSAKNHSNAYKAARLAAKLAKIRMYDELTKSVFMKVGESYTHESEHRLMSLRGYPLKDELLLKLKDIRSESQNSKRNTFKLKRGNDFVKMIARESQISYQGKRVTLVGEVENEQLHIKIVDPESSDSIGSVQLTFEDLTSLELKVIGDRVKDSVRSLYEVLGINVQS